MPVNANRPDRWKADIAQSVDFYNDWFLRFAPLTFRQSRGEATEQVLQALSRTDNLRNLSPQVLRESPGVLSMLRMTTAPPIARDRLVGLASVPKALVQAMESQRQIPSRMAEEQVVSNLIRIRQVILRLVDEDLFPWLTSPGTPTDQEVRRAASVVADRLCGVLADPIIRNAQEQRQLGVLRDWLVGRGYRLLDGDDRQRIGDMAPGTFMFRVNVRIQDEKSGRALNIPVDSAIMPMTAPPNQMPLLIEAKSAGDFTNPNKRWKEEATKMGQLRNTYVDVHYILFLCGYFNLIYLMREATEGIDWVWEHRIDDLAELGL